MFSCTQSTLCPGMRLNLCFPGTNTMSCRSIATISVNNHFFFRATMIFFGHKLVFLNLFIFLFFYVLRSLVLIFTLFLSACGHIQMSPFPFPAKHSLHASLKLMTQSSRPTGPELKPCGHTPEATRTFVFSAVIWQKFACLKSYETFLHEII